jgi:CelD/BcsL family acetyltransferase involved in cellulose biosynthesis
MEYKLHQDFAEFSAQSWDGLASRSISDTPFARHEYMRLWWASRGGGEWPAAQLVLVSARDGGETIGIAPMFVAEHDGRKALLLVGSIEISDYLDLVVQPANAAKFTAGLLDHLEQSNEYSNLPLDWYNIPESSPTLDTLRSEASRRGWQFEEEIYRPTPYVGVGKDFDGFLDGLDKKQRHEIRRKLRRAGEGSVPAQFALLEDKASLDSAIDEFLELMAHDNHKRAFLSPGMRVHMHELMRWAWDARILWLAYLRVGGVAAAAAFNFDYGGKLWGYNSAVNRDFLEISPGWVLLAHQIRWACEHGRRELDFMRGDEDYKYRFGAVDRHVLRVRVTPG